MTLAAATAIRRDAGALQADRIASMILRGETPPPGLARPTACLSLLQADRRQASPVPESGARAQGAGLAARGRGCPDVAAEPANPATLSVVRKWISRVPKPVTWSLVGLVALVMITMVLDAAIFYNKAHAGVSIAGQSVSGLTHDDAVQKMEQFVAQCQSSPITLAGGDKTWQVMPADVGAQMDVAEAVALALDKTRQSNLVVDMATKLKLYFSGQDVPLQGSVDFALLDNLIVDIAQELDEPAVDAGFTIRGTVVATIKEQEGLIVDQEALRQQLIDAALSMSPANVQIPMVVDKPNVVAADNQTALNQARTMISAPVTLAWGEKSWTFTPEEISSFIEFTTASDSDSFNRQAISVGPEDDWQASRDRRRDHCGRASGRVLRSGR